MKAHIIAMGGGGFSMEPRNPLLDLYFLKQTGKRRPRVCFVPTASAESESYIRRFYRAFKKLSCRPTHLSLFHPPTNLEALVLSQDALYVGGGNTKSMLAVWREWELDRILRKAWHQGVVLGGISAGSICWFEEGLTDSIPGRWTVLPCLGFLPGSNCPHYDGEPGRRPAYRRAVARGDISGGLAAEDGVALHFIGRKLYRVVSSRPNAAAYRLGRTGKHVKAQRIVPVYLGHP
jgi:dipeptidase E